MRSSRYGKYRFANRSRAENLASEILFFVYKFFTFAISTGVSVSIAVSRLLASAFAVSIAVIPVSYTHLAIPIRPPSSVCIAIGNPLPSTPSRFSFGILQSSKISSYVDDPRIPIFFSLVPKEKPGAPLSTINAEKFFFFLPLLSSVTLVIAITM